MRKTDRNRLIYTVLLIICIVGFWLFENFYTPGSYSSSEDDHLRTQIPEYVIPATTDGEIVHHDHFTLSYKEAFEQAEWVSYVLRKEHLTYDDRERPDFIEDPYVSSKSADWRNYRGSGYDRGHLCPAGDRRFSDRAYSETFYTSNISPQERDFNAGIWNDLEQQVRLWAKKHDELYVITAGILEPGLYTIGDEDVAVPKRFYKIVARGNSDDLRVLGFLLPHDADTGSLKDYLVSIDLIEQVSGIDFFKGLPDEMEEEIEREVRSSGWRFTTIR